MSYQVLVGNIGQVYKGSDYSVAIEKFKEYKKQSISNTGRACGEDVTLIELTNNNAEILNEFEGSLSREERVKENKEFNDFSLKSAFRGMED